MDSGGDLSAMTRDTLAVKLSRVLADTVFSGKSFQSLLVFGWCSVGSRIACNGCDIGSREAAVRGLSFGGLLVELVLICPPSHFH